MHNRQIAGMKPTASRCRGGGVRIFEIALHHGIATQQYLANGLAVSRHRLHGCRVNNLKRPGQNMRHPLPRHFLGPLGQWHIHPVMLHFTD